MAAPRRSHRVQDGRRRHRLHHQQQHHQDQRRAWPRTSIKDFRKRLCAPRCWRQGRQEKRNSRRRKSRRVRAVAEALCRRVKVRASPSPEDAWEAPLGQRHHLEELMSMALWAEGAAAPCPCLPALSVIPLASPSQQMCDAALAATTPSAGPCVSLWQSCVAS